MIASKARSYNKKAPRVARGAQSLTVSRQMQASVHEEIFPTRFTMSLCACEP
jgi:hypothetical protein